MSFVSTDPPSHKGTTNTWLTPLELIKELGKFDLDPCAFPEHWTADNLCCLPKCDGLSCDWYGRVWLNPPYGKHTKDWLLKLQNHGNGVALVFGRLETKWIQPFIKEGFFQLEGRIKFLDENLMEQSNAGSPSILIPFGRKNIGAILSSNLKGKWYQ